ncbi:unnamed protein product [Caenorhabditis nigoni]
MKLLLVSLLLLAMVLESGPMKMNPFNFRVRILKQFNQARRLLASGDIAKLMEILNLIPPLAKLVDKEGFGPASDMYKLVWNRQLEQAAFEYIAENGASMEKFGTTLRWKDYIGFHWMGDFWRLLDMAVGAFVPMAKIERIIKQYAALIESLIILIWMALAAPKKLPIAKGDTFGAAEAVFARRFEIGCYSNIAYSICFVKKLPYQKAMFTVGAACSGCDTHCESWKTAEGIEELGELCVPPTGFYAQQQTELKSIENFSGDASMIVLTIFFTIMVYRRLC